MRRPRYPQPYPDPFAIEYQTTLPPPFPPQLTSVTKLAPNRPAAPDLYPLHVHQAFVDSGGEGVTDTVASHYHRVKDGKVLPDQSDGHYHVLTGLPSGAGGVFRNFG